MTGSAAPTPQAPPRGAPRPLLRELAQATLAARLLVVTALIVLYLRAPNPVAAAWAGPVAAAAVLYGLGFTAYGVQSARRAEQATRWALPGDVALLWIGMLITAAPLGFVLLGVPLVAAAGLLAGYGGAAMAAAALAFVQLPGLPGSIFGPAQWVNWMLLAFALFAAAGTGGAAAHRLESRLRVTRAISEIAAVVASRAEDAAPASILETVARHFRAASGAIALLDPIAGHLDVLASVGGTPSSLGASPDAGENLAGWIARGGRAVLLTPGAEFPLRVTSSLVRSSMCVACAVANRPTGVVILHREAAEPEFTRDDLDDAQILAAAAAPYLLRVHDERVWSAALTTLAGGHAKVGYALTRDPVVLWPALLDLIRSLTAARCAVLALEDRETGNVEIVAARGLNGEGPRTLLPPLIAAITMGEIQRPKSDGATPPIEEGREAENPHRGTPMAYIPLRVGSRVIGALGLDAADGAPFSGPLLPAIASHIAAAVDTARTAHRVADIGAAEERRRVAREMHDGLAQTLANALLQTDLCAAAAESDHAPREAAVLRRAGPPPTLARELVELRSLLEQAMRELRAFMAELRRTDGRDDRLAAALERLARETERRHHLAVSVTASGDDTHVPPAVRHAVLAIARQALANVQAHARATRAAVRAQITDEWCSVSVADDGIGFDVHAYRAGPAAGHHLGLPSMEERAGLVGGRLQIDSEPARGTTITVQVPLSVRHG